MDELTKMGRKDFREQKKTSPALPNCTNLKGLRSIKMELSRFGDYGKDRFSFIRRRFHNAMPQRRDRTQAFPITHTDTNNADYFPLSRHNYNTYLVRAHSDTLT